MSETEQQESTEQAFEGLRAEVSLARRAVEGLAAERQRTDYSETMGRMTVALEAVLAAQKRIEASPALKLTPEGMQTELLKASAGARAEDARLIDEARDRLWHAIGAVDAIVRRGQAAGRNRRREEWIGGGGLIVGILFWAIFPGALARSLPESWHVPEWMAARTMDLDTRAAGQRLIAVGEEPAVTATMEPARARQR